MGGLAQRAGTPADRFDADADGDGAIGAETGAPEAPDELTRSDDVDEHADERGDRADERARGFGRARATRQLFLALALLLSYGFFVQSPAWNENSRFDLIRAVVEQGRLTIDSYHENTGDKAFKDGHYYSDKAPGTAIVGVPVYAAWLAIDRATGHPEPDPDVAVGVLALGVSAVPTILTVLLLVRLLLPVVGEPWALVTGIAYGLGTIAFPFATMFFGHALSTFALFASFWLLHRHRESGRAWLPVAAGFVGGWAVLTEIPVVLGVAILAAYALWQGRTVALRYVVGGVPVALLLGAYDWVTFGSPLSLGYQYSTLFGAQNAQGIVSIVVPSPAVLAQLLFDPRGLLVLAPWLAVAPLGLLALRDRRVRAEVVVAAAVCVAFLTYNSGALNPFGGWTPGPRYLTPMLPFAAILVALAPRRIRLLTGVLMALSVVVMLVATSTRPNAEEVYANPLVQLWLPRLRSGHLAATLAWDRWGFAGQEPLILLVIGLLVALAGILATRSADRVSRAATVVSGAVLVVLVLACSIPVPPPATELIGGPDASGSSPIVVAASGAYRITAGGDDRIVIWAQLENRGAAVSGTRIEFRIATAGTEADASAAWYGDVAWQPAQRRVTTLDWPVRGADPAAHRYEIRVLGTANEVLGTTGGFIPFPSG